MAEFWYRDAAVWRKAKEIWYKDATVWRQAKELWYKDAGVWVKVFSPGFTAFSMASYVIIGTGETEPGFEQAGDCAIKWDPTGQLYRRESSAGISGGWVATGDWGRPIDSSGAAGAEYEIYLTLLSISGAGSINYVNLPLNTWTSMATYSQITVAGSVSGGADKYAAWNAKIRKVGTGVNLIDVNFSMRAETVMAL